MYQLTAIAFQVNMFRPVVNVCSAVSVVREGVFKPLI
jgi:hypothetical protein